MKKCYTTLECIIELLPIKSLAELCGIHRPYCYQLLREGKTKAEIFKMYCEII